MLFASEIGPCEFIKLPGGVWGGGIKILAILLPLPPALTALSNLFSYGETGGMEGVNFVTRFSEFHMEGMGNTANYI